MIKWHPATLPETGMGGIALPSRNQMIHNTKLRDNISYASYVSNKQFDTINMLPLHRAEFVHFQLQQNNMLIEFCSILVSKMAAKRGSKLSFLGP